MRVRDILIVAKREYLTRLKSKGFWLSTLLIPLLMGGWVFIQGLVMSKATAELRLAVVDLSGHFLEALQQRVAGADSIEGAARFQLTPVEPGQDHEALRSTLNARVLEDELDAWLWIREDALATGRVEYHGENVSNFITQEVLAETLSAVAREQRLTAAGYDVEAIEALSGDIELATIQLSEEGSQAKGGIGTLALGVGLFFVLYMVLIIYGNQVMQGVLEEKSSRIVEVLVATLSPVELLSGKLAGICGAALTQLGIWMATAVVLTAPGLVAAVASLPEGFELPTIPASVVIHFFLLFLLGFVLYASFYAMLGAAFNDAQEAQQLAGFVVIFLVAPMLVFMPVANDPNSTLAVVMSLIPIFTPLIMTLRVAIQMPPWWQLALGYGLTLLACVASIWIAGRIYRVGILMYGKKPTLKELARWVRYA